MRNDGELLRRSGLTRLEAKLSGDIVTYKKELLREKMVREIGSLVNSSRSVIIGQIKESESAYRELAGLRGQNREVIDSMINKLQTQRDLYTKEVNSFHTTRQMLLSEVQVLLGLLSLNRFDALMEETRKNLKGSWTTQGIRAGMADMFGLAAKTLTRVDRQAAKIRTLVEQIYERFHREHGLVKITPERFSVQPYTEAFDQLEHEATAFRNSARLVMTEQSFIVRSFFITLASRAREIFSESNLATRNWSKSILTPIYSQIQEHKIMIDRRLENLDKLKVNHASLESRIEASATEIRELRQHLAMVDNILQKLYDGGEADPDENSLREATG